MSVILALFLLQNAPGSAQDTAPDPAPAAERAEPPLVIPGVSTRRSPRGADGPGLDALLQLPTGFLDGESRAVAGADEGVWRSRFARAHRELEEARSALERTKQELDSAAEGGGSSTWSVAPPGGGGSTGGPSSSPLSFKLRQQMKEDRERLEAADRAMRELKIEAELARVPANWRGNADSETKRSISN